MITRTIEIDNDGNLKTIYDDELFLQDVGDIYNIHRASNIEFNEDNQEWVVRIPNIMPGLVIDIFSHKSREKCIEFEIENMQPGGKYYNENK